MVGVGGWFGPEGFQWYRRAGRILSGLDARCHHFLLICWRSIADLSVLPAAVNQKIVIDDSPFLRVSDHRPRRILTRMVTLRLLHHRHVTLRRHRLLKLRRRYQLWPPLVFETDAIHRVVLDRLAPGRGILLLARRHKHPVLSLLVRSDCHQYLAVILGGSARIPIHVLLVSSFVLLFIVHIRVFLLLLLQARVLITWLPDDPSTAMGRFHHYLLLKRQCLRYAVLVHHFAIVV